MGQLIKVAEVNEGNYNSSGIPVVGGGIFQGVINGNESVLIDAFTSGIFRVSNGGGSESIGWRFDFTVASVPEPGTGLLMSLALVGLACYGWRKRKPEAVASSTT